ncbi:MAG TPA: hypothetical protein VEK07_14995 [Polyangiaceae bacterium]|nr:hypothetical protein [Polyangiaceae bacterium]
MSQGGKSRDNLLHEADAVRARLLETVERLDRRRHEVLDVKLQLQRYASTLAAIALVALVITGSAVGFAVARMPGAAARRRRDRWRLARSVWRRPDRALRAARGPFFSEVLRGVAMSVVTMALTSPARSVVREILAAASRVERPTRPSDGAPAS